MQNNIQFGTDGWRGLIDSEVNNQTIGTIAQAFSEYLWNNSKSTSLKVAVGFDGRKSSQKFARVFARVLSGNGINAYLSEKITATPIVSYYVYKHKLNAGVMITASHNPPNYNGVKFKAHYGGPFFTEQTKQVEEFISNSLVQADDDKIYQVDFLADYIQHIEMLIDFDAIKNAKLNILIDSMSGAGQQIIENMLLKYDIPSKTIFKIAEKDFSGRLAEPIEKNLAPLCDELLKGNNYSLGIATDGDADRLGVMLENGKWLSAQKTILLLCDYIVNGKKLSGNIVKTSSVTDKLRNSFENKFRKVIDVQVGFKYICEKMISEDIAFGCEESGGYAIKDHIPERDGLLSGLLFIELLAKSGYKKLSDLLIEKEKQFGDIFYDRIDLAYTKLDRNEILPKLFSNQPSRISKFKVLMVSDYYSSRNIVNGLKFYLEGNNRWLLLRSSETEPVIRIYAEGNSMKEVTALLEAGEQLIEDN